MLVHIEEWNIICTYTLDYIKHNVHGNKEQVVIAKIHLESIISLALTFCIICNSIHGDNEQVAMQNSLLIGSYQLFTYNSVHSNKVQ